MQSTSLPSFLHGHTIIPVVTLTDVEQAVPLAEALAAGGIHIIEITLRTPAGLAAIERIRQELPDFIVGAGTVVSTQAMQQVAALGAHFAVSPGITQELVLAAKEQNLFYLPGVVTPSEIMLAISHGLSHLKFFPAERNGGTSWLKQTASVFPDIQFCATGGINPDNLNSYLACDNIFAVGGSWMMREYLTR